MQAKQCTTQWRFEYTSLVKWNIPADLLENETNRKVSFSWKSPEIQNG